MGDQGAIDHVQDLFAIVLAERLEQRANERAIPSLVGRFAILDVDYERQSLRRHAEAQHDFLAIWAPVLAVLVGHLQVTLAFIGALE